jgi:two-component system LytT family response regulator
MSGEIGLAVAPTKIRLVIVDDEAPARALLAEYLEDNPRVEVVAQCANGFEAVKVVADLQPDVLLLDVQMPKLDGFEVLELLAEPRPAVIFVTAFDQYAIDAFAVNAVDYLLKPVTPERLVAALDRVASETPPLDAGAPEPSAAALRAAARPGHYLDRILVREGSRIHVIPLERVDYFEAQSDYVQIVAGGEKRRKQQTLTDLETLLDPAHFVRVHRSYILHIDRMARIELYAKDSRVAILRDRTRIPISRPGYARLRALL